MTRGHPAGSEDGPMTTTHRTVAADSRATLVTGRAPLARALAQGLRDRGRPVEALEPQDALDAIRGGRAGGIVHVPGAACAATVGEQATHAAGAVESAARVLEAARIAGLRGRIVLLSSTGVYGDRAGSITESAEARPATP